MDISDFRSQLDRADGKYRYACLLFGHYMNTFADLEYSISLHIGRLFNLSYKNIVSFTCNMGYSAKINTLATGIETFSNGIMTDEWRDEAARMPAKLMKLTGDRNLAAHSFFDWSPCGGITFSKTTARGVIFDELITWTEQDVGEKCERINALNYAIGQIVSELVHASGGYVPPRLPNELINPLTPLYLEDSRKPGPP